MQMLFKHNRRRFRNRFTRFLIILFSCLLIWFFLRNNSKYSQISQRKDLSKRLYCIVLNTHIQHEPFVQLSNQTWSKHCQRTSIVKYQHTHKLDDETNNHKLPYHIHLWERIIDAMRQLIQYSDEISIDDALIIVPAPTFVFPKKVFSQFQSNAQFPLIIIHEQQEASAYLMNSYALDSILNTNLIDSCLQQSYPSAREKHLWKCIDLSLRKQYRCQRETCFIRYQHYYLTLEHIKNGFCLQNASSSQCQSIPLLYPITLNDLITLEFFYNRVKK